MRQNSKSISLFASGWILLSAIIICLQITSCQKDGAGEIVTKDVIVPEFRILDIDAAVDVIIIQDTLYSVQFVGEKRIIDGYSATMNDSALKISGKRRGEFLRPNEKITEVYIHIDTLERINVFKDCSIRSENELTGRELGVVVQSRFTEVNLKLNCNVFYYWNNPDGTHLKLSGQTNELKIWNSGLGSVDASEVTSPYVQVINGSQSDCKVRATQKLEYGLTSIGNIIFYGNPAEVVSLEITGTGELIKGD